MRRRQQRRRTRHRRRREISRMRKLIRLQTHMRVGTRIGGGFLLVLSLLLAMAVVDYRGLAEAQDDFLSYSATSDNAVRVLDLDRRYLALRRAVLLFLQR